MSETARLSKLLWDAREIADMYSDMLRARGMASQWIDQHRDEIDAYRAERGWSPNGFGGEE